MCFPAVTTCACSQTQSTSKCITTHQGYIVANVHFIEQSLLHSKVSIAQTIMEKLLRFIIVSFNLLNSRHHLWEEMQILWLDWSQKTSLPNNSRAHNDSVSSLMKSQVQLFLIPPRPLRVWLIRSETHWPSGRFGRYRLGLTLFDGDNANCQHLGSGCRPSALSWMRCSDLS